MQGNNFFKTMSLPLKFSLAKFGFLEKPVAKNIVELSDEEILLKSQSEPRVFEVLVKRLDQAFIRKARRIVGDDRAVDAVQDTFIKIYRYSSKFRPVEGASFRSWAYKILINTCLTYVKKYNKEQTLSVGFDVDYETVADTRSRDFEKLESADEVRTILVKMPAMLGRVLREFFINGKSQQEIATLEQVEVGVIRTRLHRAKKKFKDISLSIV